MAERLADLAERKNEALHAGSPRAVEKHHAKGKLTARERIDYLLDEGSFQELDMLARHRAHGMGLEDNRPYTDGVVTGFGTIDGRRVCIFSQDFTVFGGALGEVFAEKIHKVMDLAASTGVPMIGPSPSIPTTPSTIAIEGFTAALMSRIEAGMPAWCRTFLGHP